MASQITSGTQAATVTTEHSLYSTTTAGVYELTIDVNAMVAGDELEYYVKEKTLSGSTARTVFFDACSGAQIQTIRKTAWISVVHYAEFLIKQTAGTGRSFDWSVRRVDTAMGTAGLTATAVDDIWDEATSGHSTAGTTGKALTDAGSAGDPWSTAVPGSYTSGTAGYRIGNALSNSGTVTLGATGMDNVLDATSGIETGLTLRGALRLMAAAVAGKISGGGTTTVTFRNAVADGKNRIVATVDTNGNRSAITYDLT